MKPSYDNKIGKVIYNDVEIPLDGGSSGAGAIIRTAELSNVDITLAKDGTIIETKNTGAGGKVDFTVNEVGTYTLSTSTWSKEVVIEELNTIVKAYAGTLDNYTMPQIHEACQGGYASLMWKPKDQWTYPADDSIYSGKKLMITSIKQVNGKEQIKWCLADKLSANYTMSPRFAYLSSSNDTSWLSNWSTKGGMKYSAMERRCKVQGEEVYSHATSLLPEDYSGTLTTGIKLSELFYTDQNGVLCKLFKYNEQTDSFTEDATVIYPEYNELRNLRFIKGYFKSVGTIDEATFNSGYYYIYNSSYYVYTRATTYTSGTTYYGLYETLQEDGVFIAGLSSIRQYLVKEERLAATGGDTGEDYLSSFIDYVNLLAVEEITGLYRGLTLPSGVVVSGSSGVYISAYPGEGQKEEGFDFDTQVTGSKYWTRSVSSGLSAFNLVNAGGTITTDTAVNANGVRVCFTTN